MLLISLFFLTLFLLIGAFFLTATICAFRRTPIKESMAHIEKAGNLFYYRRFHAWLFSENEHSGIFFAAICAENVVRFSYGASAVVFLSQTQLFQESTTPLTVFWLVLNIFGFILASFILGDYLPRLFGTRMPDKAISFCAPVTSFFLFLVLPITYPFLKIAQSFSQKLYFDHTQSPDVQAKHEILQLFCDAKIDSLNTQDKQLLSSILNFRSRIAREVMVPRVDIFSLPASTSIRDAAEKIQEVGFSRIPVYEDTVDTITGVVMYKDILHTYMDYVEGEHNPKILEATIEMIQKPVLYTPETKLISQLLQDFRREKTHIAIVVDEYGGTEGIVTIEDILEEIVGEIADEYDVELGLFHPQPDGSWIVDAKMNILDLEEETGIKISQESNYDTIGGYIAHISGSIPSAGFIIHQDDFEIEILESSERSVEKVRIKPTAPNTYRS